MPMYITRSLTWRCQCTHKGFIRRIFASQLQNFLEIVEKTPTMFEDVIHFIVWHCGWVVDAMCGCSRRQSVGVTMHVMRVPSRSWFINNEHFQMHDFQCALQSICWKRHGMNVSWMQNQLLRTFLEFQIHIWSIHSYFLWIFCYQVNISQKPRTKFINGMELNITYFAHIFGSLSNLICRILKCFPHLAVLIHAAYGCILLWIPFASIRKALNGIHFGMLVLIVVYRDSGDLHRKWAILFMQRFDDLTCQ